MRIILNVSRVRMHIFAISEKTKSKGANMNKSLTHSMEDYLEIIYILQKNEGIVRITDIANAMSYSKASVSQAINLLKSEELVVQERYGKIELTPKGLKEAKFIYAKHKILSEFFTKVLNVNPKTAETDACKVEHVLSSETLHGIECFLDKYKSGGINFEQQ